MIGLGAKYLTAAGFGRYRITAASLGSLDLLGTFGWLTAATKQAIMAAFGVDGKAVIRATNEYLNGIAAQGQAGRDKATALADAMNSNTDFAVGVGGYLYYYQAVEWLGNNSLQTYINPNLNASQVLTYHFEYTPIDQVSTAAVVCGDGWNMSGGIVCHTSGRGCEVYNYGKMLTAKTRPWGSKVVIDFDGQYVDVNGDIYDYGTGTNSNSVWYILKANAGYWGHIRLHCARYTTANKSYYLMPCYRKSDSEKGLYDLMSGEFYTNAGSGTFLVGDDTIPDISYTPTP